MKKAHAAPKSTHPKSPAATFKAAVAQATAQELESGKHAPPDPKALARAVRLGLVSRNIQGNLDRLYRHVALLGETIETLSPGHVGDEGIAAIRTEGLGAVVAALTNIRWACHWVDEMPKGGVL